MQREWVIAGVVILAVAIVLVVRKSGPQVESIPSVFAPATENTEIVDGQGARKALLIGINYWGTQYELNGCISDVTNLAKVLTGVERVMLTDRTPVKPTKANIQQAVKTFVASLQPGDEGILWYSGHGLLLDGREENAWAPLDFQTEGFIDETWLKSQLAQIPSGVRLLVGSDSCHSGTLLDLPYQVSVGGRTLSAGSTEAKQARTSDPKVSTQKRLNHASKLAAVQRDIASEEAVLVQQVGESVAASIVVLSGCRDPQTSADAMQSDGSYQGAMTHAFLAAVAPDRSLAHCLHMMQTSLEEAGYTQIPEMHVSSTMDVNRTTFADFGF